jgi:hypothetical protein
MYARVDAFDAQIIGKEILLFVLKTFVQLEYVLFRITILAFMMCPAKGIRKNTGYFLYRYK